MNILPSFQAWPAFASAANRIAPLAAKPERPLAARLFFACSLASATLAPMTLARADASDASKPLSGNDLRRTVSGKRIYLATPFGGEFPLYYRQDGQVDGTGEALGLGRFLKPTDSGRWWVDGSKLCQQWKTWYDGKVSCFEVTDRGNGRIGWVRDDGDKGIARLGN